MGTQTKVLVIAMVGTLAACGRTPHLAGGPIDLSERPTRVRFLQPLPSQGQTWELCFEFDRPRHSHRAGAIHATLVSSSGGRAAILTTELDRRGESVVCQIGRVAPPEPNAERTVYESVELYSDVPLRLRGLRGGSRP